MWCRRGVARCSATSTAGTLLLGVGLALLVVAAVLNECPIPRAVLLPPPPPSPPLPEPCNLTRCTNLAVADSLWTTLRDNLEATGDVIVEDYIVATASISALVAVSPLLTSFFESELTSNSDSLRNHLYSHFLPGERPTATLRELLRRSSSRSESQNLQWIERILQYPCILVYEVV